MPLLQKNVCVACHAADSKLVGPSWREVAGKYKAQADAAAYLAGKIRAGGQGVWGSIPMPAQSISEADAQRVARWLAHGGHAMTASSPYNKGTQGNAHSARCCVFIQSGSSI
jgi:cytochrome c551/c552